ncbi:MAG: SpoIIE family protein phosphatase [Candidatus Zhuqueibacterota bacterium]
MAYFDTHPKQFRLMFSAIAVTLMYIAGYNFYRIATLPTDENLFTAPPSQFYITRPFSGELFPLRGRAPKFAPASDDSARIGDYLLGNDQKKMGRSNDWLKRLNAAPDDSFFTIILLRSDPKEIKQLKVRKSALPDSFFRVLPSAAHVIKVNPGGASERAGMHVGDLIVRINGRTFNDIWEADRIMRSARAGKTINYDIIRRNRTITLHVTLASFGFPIIVLLQLLAGASLIGAAFFFAMVSASKKSARLLSFAMLICGYALALTFGRLKIEFDDFAIVRYLTQTMAIAIGLAFWLDSAYFFPKEWKDVAGKKWIRRIPYVAAIGFSLYVIIDFFRHFKTIHEQTISILFLVALAYNFAVHFIFRKQRAAELKRLSRIIALTIYGLTLPNMVILLLTGVDTNYEVAAHWVLLYCLVPLAYIYTIGRYKLLDLKLSIRKNVQHTIISSAWLLLLLALFIRLLSQLPKLAFRIPNIRLTITSFEIIDEPLSPGQQDFIEKILVMGLAIGFTLLFWKIRRWGQTIIDKKYYRLQFDYGKSANALAEVMATKLTIMDLARGIAQKLTELLQLKSTGIVFFRDEETCCYQAAYRFDGMESQEFNLDVRQAFVRVLRKLRTDSRFSVDYLPPDLKSYFEQCGFQHIIPIWFKDRLVGTLLIGEKLSEAPTHADDLTFFTAVAKQSSVAIENAFLHEEITEQERLKHELMIARRIQLASLPQHTPIIEGLEISGTSIPATEVGGDYFDYLNGEPHSVNVIVGDVSGKGTSAALYLFKIQGILRSLFGFGLKPRELFIRANQILYRDLDKQSFVTAISGLFETQKRRVVLARAGHQPLFYYHAGTETVQIITPRGLGLGLDSEKIFSSEIEEKVITYDVGDIFLFVTDGITEAQSRDRIQFGEEKLADVLKGCNAESALAIRDSVINAVKDFTIDMSQHDDQTVVVVKVI